MTVRYPKHTIRDIEGPIRDGVCGPVLETESGAIPPAVREQYLAATRRPEVIHAMCDDYRASAFIDGDRDERDRREGRRLAMPVLAAWQDPGDTPLPFDPQQIWSSWATDLRIVVLPCGHFLPEERPDDVVAAITDLLST